MEQDCQGGITPAIFRMSQNKDASAVKPFRKLAFLCGTASLAALGACHQAPAPAPQESASEAEGPDAKPGMSASDGRMVLPVVPGRPAAVYFSVSNGGADLVKLVGVDVAAAGKAEMHKTEGGSMAAVTSVDVPAGGTVAFAPGSYHVMVFDPESTLKPGGTTELTLTFADGDKLSMPLKIEAMGAGTSGHAGADESAKGMDDMAGMHH